MSFPNHKKHDISCSKVKSHHKLTRNGKRCTTKHNISIKIGSYDFNSTNIGKGLVLNGLNEWNKIAIGQGVAKQFVAST